MRADNCHFRSQRRAHVHSINMVVINCVWTVVCAAWFVCCVVTEQAQNVIVSSLRRIVRFPISRPECLRSDTSASSPFSSANTIVGFAHVLLFPGAPVPIDTSHPSARNKLVLQL